MLDAVAEVRAPVGAARRAVEAEEVADGVAEVARARGRSSRPAPIRSRSIGGPVPRSLRWARFSDSRSCRWSAEIAEGSSFPGAPVSLARGGGTTRFRLSVHDCRFSGSLSVALLGSPFSVAGVESTGLGMEERGWIDAEWGHTEQGKRAKFYQLTAAGRRQLRKETEQWERYAAGVARVLTTKPKPA